jgi:hypothetical protein
VSQMLPDDMQSLIGGGGGFPPAGPAPAGPPPIPPDMAAAMQAPPPPEGALHCGSAAEGDPNSLVAEAIDLLEQAAKSSPDDQQIQTILKCITQLQGTLASAEKAADSGDVTPMLAADTSY